MVNETDEWLSHLVTHVGAVAGTVHVREGNGLRLMSAVNIPDVVKKAVEFGRANKDADVSPVNDNFDPRAEVNKRSALAWHFGGDDTRPTARPKA